MHQLTDYIKIIDNLLSEEDLEIFIEICKKNIFNLQDAGVGAGGVVYKKIRSTKNTQMKNFNTNSMTMVYWTNKLYYKFSHAFREYCSKIDSHSDLTIAMEDLQLLRYDVGDFYKTHIDSFTQIPRTISYILLVNDDYKGGELFFEFSKEKKMEVEVKKNRLIIWPSNFLYPHGVNKVTEGTKFSVVAWGR
tara:strand:+ start:1630 stop:2202 length:573 start_codon:yes stop_codon:yes gene_type:complete